jgi:hypothetical protein
MFTIAYMFPETVNWLASADEYVPLSLYSFRVLNTLGRIIHVGISCEI